MKYCLQHPTALPPLLWPGPTPGRGAAPWGQACSPSAFGRGAPGSFPPISVSHGIGMGHGREARDGGSPTAKSTEALMLPANPQGWKTVLQSWRNLSFVKRKEDFHVQWSEQRFKLPAVGSACWSEWGAVMAWGPGSPGCWVKLVALNQKWTYHSLPPGEVFPAAAGSCPACGHDSLGNVGPWWRLRWRVTCRGAGETLTLGRGMKGCRRMGTGMRRKAGKVPGRSSYDLLYPGWGGGGQPKAVLFSL